MSDRLSPERLTEIRGQDISWMTDNEVRELLAHVDTQAGILDTFTEMHRIDTDYGIPHLCGHCLRQWPCIDAQTLQRGQE